jgi:hypothetical protein
MSSSKNLTCKGTLRQVFIRDYRPETGGTVVNVGIFDPALWTVAPLQCVRGGGMGFWASDIKHYDAKSLYRSIFLDDDFLHCLLWVLSFYAQVAHRSWVQLDTAASLTGSSFRHPGRGQDLNTLQIATSVKSIKIATPFSDSSGTGSYRVFGNKRQLIYLQKYWPWYEPTNMQLSTLRTLLIAHPCLGKQKLIHFGLNWLNKKSEDFRTELYRKVETYIPRNETARPHYKFLHSCICERFKIPILLSRS